MRRSMLFGVAVVAAVGALAAPAFAQPDEIEIHTPYEVHTLNQSRISDDGATTFSCGNAWRDIVCDAFLNAEGETVYVGNKKRGASLSIYEASKQAPNSNPSEPNIPEVRDAVYVSFVTEAHTRGVQRAGGEPYVSLSCGNVPRQIACDTLQGETPQQVVVGNETHGASVHVVSGEGLNTP